MDEEEVRGQHKIGHKQRYYLYCGMEIALCIISVALACLKTFSGHSLCYWLGVLCPFFHRVIDAGVINTDAVNAVAGTVGFGSILIGWVYATLDKEELGIRYADLLAATYPKYHYFVLAHLLAVLFCQWMVQIKYLEAAWWFMTIILWGSIIHWKVLANIIFSTRKRKSIAIAEWGREVDREKDNPSRLLTCIYGIEQALPFDDGVSLKGLCGPMFRGIQQYATSFCPNSQDNAKQQVFRDMVSIWECLLTRRSPNQQDILLKNLFQTATECSSMGEREKIGSRVICATYICWLYENEKKGQWQKENSLSNISEVVDYLVSNIRAKSANTNPNNEYPEVFRTSLSFVYWISLLSGRLCDTSALHYQIEFPLNRMDKEVMATLSRFLFGKCDHDQYFETVWLLLSS